MGHWRKQMITFFITSHCNLGCNYCYIPEEGTKYSKKDAVIDIEFAVQGMKDYFAWSKDPHIRFFSSGEATTAFETMEYIYNEAYKLAGEELKVELQTNGYFSSSVADWIDRNIDILWISDDGPPEIQNNQRPTLGGNPSSEIVFENIQRFVKNKKMQFGVRVTFAPNNFSKQIDILKFFRELGVRNVCGAPVYNEEVASKKNSTVFQDFSKMFVPAFFKAQEMGMFYMNHLMVNFDEKVKCYCRACTKPISPHLTSDGYVSCCDRVPFGPEYLSGNLEQCIYGKWDERNRKIVYFNENKERIENRNIDTLSHGDCKNCEVLEHCAGGCIGKIMLKSDDIYKMDSDWCEAVRYLARNIPMNEGLYPFYHS